jgi:hypothetical protein
VHVPSNDPFAFLPNDAHISNIIGDTFPPNLTYVNGRVNAVGGVRPEECPAGQPNVTVPFTADYIIYSCPDVPVTGAAMVAGKATISFAMGAALVALLF